MNNTIISFTPALLKVISCLSYYYRTLEERAMRLFSTKGKNLEDLDPAMFAKSKPGRAGKARYVAAY